MGVGCGEVVGLGTCGRWWEIDVGRWRTVEGGGGGCWGGGMGEGDQERGCGRV